MKPFLGIDLTQDKKNSKPNGMEMMVLKPSPELVSALDSSKEKMNDAQKKAKLPLVLRIIEWICTFGGIFIVIGLLRALGGEDGVTLTQAYANAGEIFWIAGACIAIGAVLRFLGKKKAKTVLESDDSTRTLSNISVSVETIFADLGVPENARDVDILVFFYKNSNCEPKLKTKGNQNFMFMNFPFKIFADPRTFYLANIEGKYAFSRDAVKRIKTVAKRYTVNDWNKDYPFDDDRYKKYGLKMDQYGVIYGKNYYILEVENEGQIWGIYFPSYELPLFEALTGLKPEEA